MFDQIRDVNNAGLYELSTIHEFPEFVKTASESEDVKELPSRLFADPVNRVYPIHTKSDAWLSKAYFDKFASEHYNDQEREQIQENFATVAPLWGLGVEKSAAEVCPGCGKEDCECQTCEDCGEKPCKCSHSKEASGVKIEFTMQGESHAETYVSNSDELHKLAEDIIGNTEKYPWEMRKNVSRQVLAAAPTVKAKFSAPMEVLLQKSSGYGVGELDDTLVAIRQRKQAVRSHPEMQEKLGELEEACKTVSKSGLLDPEMLDKTASVLDMIDRFADLHLRYKEGFDAPEKQIYKTTPRHMDDFENRSVKLANGQYVAKEALETPYVVSFVNRFLGQKCASENVVNVVRDLPYRKAQRVYEHMCKAT